MDISIGLAPVLALTTFLIFIVYLLVMKSRTNDAQDEHDTTALAKSTTPSEKDPSKRFTKDDMVRERTTTA